MMQNIEKQEPLAHMQHPRTTNNILLQLILWWIVTTGGYICLQKLFPLFIGYIVGAIAALPGISFLFSWSLIAFCFKAMIWFAYGAILLFFLNLCFFTLLYGLFNIFSGNKEKVSFFTMSQSSWRLIPIQLLLGIAVAVIAYMSGNLDWAMLSPCTHDIRTAFLFSLYVTLIVLFSAADLDQDSLKISLYIAKKLIQKHPLFFFVILIVLWIINILIGFIFQKPSDQWQFMLSLAALGFLFNGLFAAVIFRILISKLSKQRNN